MNEAPLAPADKGQVDQTSKENDDQSADKIMISLTEALGKQLVAVYEFGSTFGRGQAAVNVRWLVLVDGFNGPTLEIISKSAEQARSAGVHLRIDTAKAILNGADCFPIFTLELLDTKKLLHGDDALADLVMPTEQLRLHIEQSLRGLHRELLQAFVERPKDHELARALRRVIRRSIYLLHALALMIGETVPEEATPEDLINLVIPKVLEPIDRSIWLHLKGFANFETRPGYHELVALVGEALQTFDSLTTVIDTYNQDDSSKD
jgi:hypothetical protein